MSDSLEWLFGFPVLGSGELTRAVEDRCLREQLIAETIRTRARLGDLMTELRRHTPGGVVCFNPIDCAGKARCPRERVCND